MNLCQKCDNQVFAGYTCLRCGQKSQPPPPTAGQQTTTDDLPAPPTPPPPKPPESSAERRRAAAQLQIEASAAAAAATTPNLVQGGSNITKIAAYAGAGLLALLVLVTLAGSIGGNDDGPAAGATLAAADDTITSASVDLPVFRCDHPSPIDSAPAPSQTGGNVIWTQEQRGQQDFHSGSIEPYSAAYYQENATRYGLPPMANEEAAYILCMTVVRPTDGSPLVCRGYDDGSSLEVWPAQVDAVLYGHRTAEEVARYRLAPGRLNCPPAKQTGVQYILSGISELDAAIKLSTVATPGEPTFLTVEHAVNEVDGGSWCSRPSPLPGVDPTSGVSGVYIASGAWTGRLSGLKAESPEAISHVVCTRFVPSDAEPRRCEYSDGVSYNSRRGNYDIWVVSAVSGQVEASTTVEGTPTCDSIVSTETAFDRNAAIPDLAVDWVTRVVAAAG